MQVSMTRSKHHSLPHMNPVDVVLSLHVDLNPAVLVEGVPVCVDVAVDNVIVAVCALIFGYKYDDFVKITLPSC